MKRRAVILHAMGQSSKGHWYPWLKAELEKHNFDVWVPDLPTPDQPDAQKMTDFLLARKDWDWSNCLLIGHSSGAVEILQLLPHIDAHILGAVLLGSFDHPLWEEEHAKLFVDPIDFESVKRKADSFIVMHGDDDPWCPLEGARHIADELEAEFIIVHGAGHFSTSLNLAFTKNMPLLEVLDSRELI